MTHKPARKIAAALTSAPMAITEDYLRLMLAIAARDNLDVTAVETQLGRKLENTATVQERNGVAIVPIIGPIFRYANLFSAISGGTSVQLLARDFTSALNNPDIRAILLHVDSPGGEVNGIAEFAQMIYQARGRKPITAYVGGLGASAAYWIASAADEIVADATAMLGSIGVIAAVPTGDDEGEMTFVSSQSPRKRPDPATEEGAADIQYTIDALAQVFVETVARNRGVTVDHVLDGFGGGALFVGKHAVAAGMADRLGAFEETLAGMGKRREGKPTQAQAAPAGHTQISGSIAAGPRPHTQPNRTKEFRMSEELQETQQAPPEQPLPPLQAPQIAASDPAVQSQVNAVVAQMTAQFEAQRQIVLEQAQAQFQRQLAEMQAQQQISTYAQHITTPTLQRQHALPGAADEYSRFLSSLSADQRKSATGLFDRILTAGLVSFEEIGSGAGGDETEQSAKEQFEAAVTTRMASGVTRLQAIQAVGREQPELYAAYQAESSRRGQVAAPSRAPAKKGGK